MKETGHIILHIPARAGSQRVKSKNLRYIAGEPLLAYTVKAALQTCCREQVYVNTDSEVMAALARELGAKVYKRSAELAADNATSDQYNMDIIETLEPGTLVQVNPVCPLLEAADIEAIIEAFKNSTADVDTLITTTATRMQCFCCDKPVNIDLETQLAPTQQNPPVHICNWAVTVWDAARFKERYRRKGFAVFGEKRVLYPVSPLKAVKISTEEDFTFAEFLLQRQQAQKPLEIAALAPRYWHIGAQIKNVGIP
jgi:CMP-N,N'-diacetyllegionaminic acid synthase